MEKSTQGREALDEHLQVISKDNLSSSVDAMGMYLLSSKELQTELMKALRRNIAEAQRVNKAKKKGV